MRNVQYKWNNEWHDNISWNWVFNDKYFDGKYITQSVLLDDYGGVYFYVKLNQYSLTEKAYKFWRLVHEQTQLSGSDIVNSGVPLYGNVYSASDAGQYSLGYFQVSAQCSKTVYIDR